MVERPHRESEREMVVLPGSSQEFTLFISWSVCSKVKKDKNAGFCVSLFSVLFNTVMESINRFRVI